MEHVVSSPFKINGFMSAHSKVGDAEGVKDGVTVLGADDESTIGVPLGMVDG